jgi:uncharacterized phage-associated protein
VAVSFSFDEGKALAVISRLASAGLPEFTKGKACKLVFLADHLHLVRYGRPITGDWFAAMDHGPVPSHTLDLLNAVETGVPTDDASHRLIRALKVDARFQFPRISASEAINQSHLSRSDSMVLDEVIEKYGTMSFKQLRTLTHEFEAYKAAWDRRSGLSSAMRFEEFFEGDEADAIAGVKEEVLENAALREALSGYGCRLS